MQLSDSAGSFSNPQNIGTISNRNHADSITAYIPYNAPLSNLYRLRVTGTSPPDTSINTSPLRIITIPAAVTIAGPEPGCIGSGVNKYYTSQKETGVNYNWSLSGGGTFTTNQDTMYVTWTNPGIRTISLNTSNICGSGSFVNKQVTISNPPPTATPVVNKQAAGYIHLLPMPDKIHWAIIGTGMIR
ncbi:MAG: hypothetical protein WDO16_17825 [Bacteroidota bacterium]